MSESLSGRPRVALDWTLVPLRWSWAAHCCTKLTMLSVLLRNNRIHFIADLREVVIIPDAFTAFAFIEANGFPAADIDKFDDEARYRGARLAATLHGLSFTLPRIFLAVYHHRVRP